MNCILEALSAIIHVHGIYDRRGKQLSVRGIHSTLQNLRSQGILEIKRHQDRF